MRDTHTHTHFTAESIFGTCYLVRYKATVLSSVRISLCTPALLTFHDVLHSRPAEFKMRGGKQAGRAFISAERFTWLNVACPTLCFACRQKHSSHLRAGVYHYLKKGYLLFEKKKKRDSWHLKGKHIMSHYRNCESFQRHSHLKTVTFLRT